MSSAQRPTSPVKALGFIAISLGVVSLAANGYAIFEAPYRRDGLKMLAYVAFGTGVLASLLGIVSGIKRFPAAWLAIPLGAAGAMWQFSWAV